MIGSSFNIKQNCRDRMVESDQTTPLEQELLQPLIILSGASPFRDCFARIIDSEITLDDPSSAMQTQSGEKTHDDPLVTVQDQKLYGTSAHKTLYKGILANGSASPLISDKDKQPSVATFMNRQSMQSSDIVDDRQYNESRKHHLRDRSINSSIMVSEGEQVSSSCGTTGYQNNNKDYQSAAKQKKSGITSPIRGKHMRLESRSDLMQQFAVQINRKRLDQGCTTDQQFIMVPVQSMKNEKGSKVAEETQVIRDRMAQTHITAASIEASHMLDQSSTKNSVLYPGGQTESLQQPSGLDSLNFDQKRYQTASKITNGSTQQSFIKRNALSIPRTSEVQVRRAENLSTELMSNSQRSKILTFDQQGAPVISFDPRIPQRNQPSQLSPASQKKQDLMETTCRYKELTWVQKGIVHATPINYGAEFKKRNTTTLRGTATKRASSRTRTLEPISENRQCMDADFLLACQPITARDTMAKTTVKKPNPYYRRTSIDQQLLAQQAAQVVDSKSLQRILMNASDQALGGDLLDTQGIVFRCSSQLPQLPKFMNKQIMLQSEEQIINKNDSAFYGTQQLKFQESLFDPATKTIDKRMINKQSILLDTNASSKDFYPSKTSQRTATQQVSKVSMTVSKNNHALAKLPHGNLNSGSIAMMTPQASNKRDLNWRKSSHDMRLKKSYETFEIPVGGKTGATIFFDGQHAEKMENEEFDRLFGQQKGRKFRFGQAIEMNQGCRTMAEQLNQLHPKLRNMLQTQYSTQKTPKKAEQMMKDKGSPDKIDWQAVRRIGSSDSKTTDTAISLPAATNVMRIQSSGVDDEESNQINSPRKDTVLSSGSGKLDQLFNKKSQSIYSVHVRKQEELIAIKALKENKQAFKKFQKLGGSFLRQPERQIITTDNEGSINYEPKSTKQKLPLNQLKRKQCLIKVKSLVNSREENETSPWEKYKDDVLQVVRKGILSNEPKPKKDIRPPTPEPEIKRLLHLEVSTVQKLIESFDDREQSIFNTELINFQYSAEPTRYLLNRIDQLARYPNDRYSVHLWQVYKMLFKKRIDMYHSKERTRKFKTDRMEKHAESFTRKVYYEFVAEVRSQLIARKVAALRDEGMNEEDAFEAAIKKMSNTKLEETKVANRRRDKEEKLRIVEYIKYLIGQTANNDFQLRREDFSQTHELHTKSLALPFDHYAAKEDNTMKRVANDILERLEMSIVIQEQNMPIAALKYASDPKFIYFMKVKEQMSLALPLLAKVVNKQLSLNNYSLNYDHCVALGQTCKYNQTFMSKVVLNNNGLMPESLYVLIQGLSHMHTISIIDIRRNQLDLKCINLLSHLMERSRPRHLQVLRIIDCKIDMSTTGRLMEIFNDRQPYLRTLSLVNVSFNRQNEQKLVEYLRFSSALRELDLSQNHMSQHAYIELLEVIVENNNLLMLNLSHNRLIIDPKTFTTEEGQLMKQEQMARFADLAANQEQQNALIRRLNMPQVQRIIRPTTSDLRNSISGEQSDRPYNDILDQIKPSTRQTSKLQPAHVEVDSGHMSFLNIDQRNDSSLKSVHHESQRSFACKEDKAKAILAAQTYVTKSSELNQLVTQLLTKVLKENRRLQHLDLTSTNLPSQVIIHLCNRLRTSRSICSVHLTDNPGLEEASLESTISNMLNCKMVTEPRHKIDVSKQIDFALNSNMLERLQKQLQDEKSVDGDDKLIAANTIRLRQIMQQKRIEQKKSTIGAEDPQQKKLILSRIIGMKEQMPGSGQWQMLTEKHEECWHCDQWIYSLVFWDAETIGRKAKKSTHAKVLNAMVKKVEQLNPEFEEPFSEVSLSVYDNDGESYQSPDGSCDNQLLNVPSTTDYPREKARPKGPRHMLDDKGKQTTEDLASEPPLIFGDFTNWKGQKMMRLDDFVLLLAKKYGRQNQDIHDDFAVIITEMKKNLINNNVRRNSKFRSDRWFQSRDRDLMSMPSISANVRSYKDLNDVQQRYYDEILLRRQKRILDGWKNVIEQYLEYRKPFLVDAFMLNTKKYGRQCPNLFVLPVFMPAGKHTYLVKNMDTFEYTMHNTLADFRSEDPPILIKELRTKHVNRVFLKENSVFESWKEDDFMSLQIACDSDLGSSKIYKILKDGSERTKLYDLIHDRFAELKLLFLQYSVTSYPCLTRHDLERLAKDFELLDGTYKLANLHNTFYSLNSKAQKFQVKMGLNRGEFIETLVRIAVAKYLQTDIVENASEAMNKLLDQKLLADWSLSPSWQNFRSRYLWTLDVNDVLFANIAGLQKLYNRNLTANKTWIEYREALNIFSSETNLVPEYHAKTCFSYSMMTITDDASGQSQHHHMHFVEFLEMVGRVAVTYWQINKESIEEVPLAKKIEFVIDQIFRIIKKKRISVNADLESESETDDDY